MKWNIFKRKKKETNTEGLDGSIGEEIGKTDYKIIIHDRLGGTVKSITPFIAKRWVDSEDRVVYLKNDKMKFLEIFPEQIEELTNLNETELDVQINNIEKIIKKEMENDNPDIDEKELEYDLRKLKAKKRSFLFSKKSSYMSFDEKGQPTFHFLREGSNFIPFKWDTETKTIYNPSENKKKSARLTLSNKESKYNTQKIITGSMIFGAIVILILITLLGYGYLKLSEREEALFTAYDQSNIAAAQRACLEDIGQVSNQVKQNSESVNNIYEKIQGELNKPQTIVEGSILN